MAVDNLGGQLNSVGSEFSAMVKSDSVIWFSSLSNDSLSEDNEVLADKYLIRIYEGEKSGGQWIRREKLDTTINHPLYHAANGSYSLDSLRFYFSR